MEKSYALEIQNEYRRIDNKWLKLHYKTSIGIVIFAIFVECFMGIFMCNTDELHTTVPIFFLKFLIIPSGINLILIVIEHFTMKTSRISQETKMYIISLLFVVICFVLFTAHVSFFALYFIFASPIALTTIYGNYKLTTITSLASMISVSISELFIKWDIDKPNMMEDAISLGNFMISLIILVAFSALCMVIIRYEKEKNETSIQKDMERHQLHQRLHTDDLTGIYNRIAFRNAMKEVEEDISENSYIFVMIDIDNFKKINDSLGHHTGDQCLKEIGKILKECSGNALPFRYGGDEFCILFKNYCMNEVVDICKNIQKSLHEIKSDSIIKTSLTASFGISEYFAILGTDKLIINTDKALYEAKTVRNTIRIHEYNNSSDAEITA